MTFSHYATEFVSPAASNFDHGRAGVKIDRIVLHHQACDDSDVTLGMMHTGSREVSANYVVRSSGVAVGVVQEQDTPYTNDHLGWNRRSITFEIENVRIGSNPYGKPSAQAHEIVAKIVADASARYGIPLDRDHVLGHRELYTRFHVGYATACPGDLDLDWIVARAKALRALITAPKASGSNPPATTLPKAVVDGTPDLATWQRAQAYLHKVAGYQGDVDGKPGTLTYKALQVFLAAQAGYKGDQDGEPGTLTWEAFQRFLAAHAGYQGVVDGAPGTLTWAAFQRWVNSLPV